MCVYESADVSGDQQGHNTIERGLSVIFGYLLKVVDSRHTKTQEDLLFISRNNPVHFLAFQASTTHTI